MVRGGRLAVEGVLTLHSPAGEMAGVGAATPGFVCPRCRGALHGNDARYHCSRCRTDFPIVLGIPDFRLDPDPWIGLAEDRAKGERLARETEGADFEGVVRAYWAMTPSTPKPLAERFIRHVLDGERRSAEWLQWALAEDGAAPPGPWLEVGCGTGDLMAAAATQGIRMVGIDIAFRWLVVAARRPGPAPGLPGALPHLVCCNAEYLPFPDASHARVVSVGTVEHCRDAGRAIAEAARVVRAGGRVRLRTVNRYTLLREPHVGVWGVGFVPRRWADSYVRWRSGQRYLHHRPLSRRELTHAMRDAGLTRTQAGATALLPSDRARLPTRLRWLGSAYSVARRAPGAAPLLGVVAPALDVSGVRP